MAKKILIADDSLFMRGILKDILSAEEKYEIIEADTGAKALQQFKKEDPDLTFLDIIMPEGEEEGMIVLKEIKKLNARAKVVMITAVGQDSIMEECRKHGATDYIVKPFDGKKIIATAKKYLG